MTKSARHPGPSLINYRSDPVQHSLGLPLSLFLWALRVWDHARSPLLLRNNVADGPWMVEKVVKRQDLPCPLLLLNPGQTRPDLPLPRQVFGSFAGLATSSYQLASLH